MELSVIIVTWNCRDLALRCLQTLLPLVARTRHEVIIVDNASSDGTLEALTAAFPGITTMANATNLGFAAANNIAIAGAAGRYLLLLNPDAFPIGNDMVETMLAFMGGNPDVAAAGPRLRRADGRHQVGDAGFAPTLGTVTVHAMSLMRVLQRSRGVFVSSVLRPVPLDVDWLSGACLMVRAAAARQVGLLDESFFMYGEDIEWGCRMRDHGWRVVYLPSVEATHLVGGTQDPDKAAIATTWLDALDEVYRRRNGARWVGVFRIILGVGFGARALLYGTLSLLPGERRLRQRARSMATYAVHGLRPRRRTALHPSA